MAITAAAQKVWKGKEWFSVISPKEIGDYTIGETPTLDSDTIVGKTIETSLMDLGGDPSKYHIKLKFRITSVQGNKALTRFEGLSCTRDHVLRMSQRRTRQVRVVLDITTKDNWNIRVKGINVMNKVVQSSISKAIRKQTEDMIKSAASQMGMYEFLGDVISGNLQAEIRDVGNKTYPVRMTEITAIEVFSAGTVMKTETKEIAEKVE